MLSNFWEILKTKWFLLFLNLTIIEIFTLFKAFSLTLSDLILTAAFQGRYDKEWSFSYRWKTNSDKLGLDPKSQNNKTAEKGKHPSPVFSPVRRARQQVTCSTLGIGREVILKSLKLPKPKFTSEAVNIHQAYAILSIYLLIHWLNIATF